MCFSPDRLYDLHHTERYVQPGIHGVVVLFQQEADQLPALLLELIEGAQPQETEIFVVS